MPQKDEKTSVENLRRNVDKLSTARTVDEISLSEIKKSIDDIETELQRKDTQVGELTSDLRKIVSEKVVAEQERNILSSKIEQLLKEKAELEENIRTLQQQRPQISSENLITTFRQSLDSMAGKLNDPAARANYVISSMNVELKTNLSMKDDVLQFQLPKPDDIIPAENLSTIEFTIRSSPKELDLSQYQEIPDLRGMTRDEAENAITDKGFKLGTINEKLSDSPQGTVTGQLPSANSLAVPGSAIDITISKVTHTETPNVVGFDIDSAREVIENSQLKMGEVTETPSRSPPGTVLKQSVEAGTMVLIGTAVDVEVAAGETVEVPKLKGKTLDTAEDLLRRAKLETGKIIKKVSSEKPYTVLAQRPEAGTPVMEGHQVDVDISIPETTEVPDVTGKHVNEAREILKSKGLRIERAINRASTLKTGTVLDQDPKPGSYADVDSVELILANRDIEMIEGIGPERGSKLRDTGIRNIKELANADPTTISEAVGKNTAEKIISMAKLIDSTSNLEGLGMDRQSAELLVKAGNISSAHELKNAEPDNLYELCKEAIASGKVKVPADHSVKQEDIKRWIEKAQ
ncbi:MAG: DUF4332 domain-containing protein [Halobacteriota archaeon]